MCQLTLTPRHELQIATIIVSPTASKKGRKEKVGLVVWPSYLILSEAESAGVTDGTTGQDRMQVEVIGLAGTWLIFGDMGNGTDWLTVAYTPLVI